MRLYKLIGLEILALQKAYKETLRKIREYKHILSNQKNMDVVQAYVLFSGCIYVLTNILIDLIYIALDPKIRAGEAVES